MFLKAIHNLKAKQVESIHIKFQTYEGEFSGISVNAISSLNGFKLFKFLLNSIPPRQPIIPI
jgi:hypothetical protein